MNIQPHNIFVKFISFLDLKRIVNNIHKKSTTFANYNNASDAWFRGKHLM